MNKVVNRILNVLIVIAAFFFLMTAGVMIEEIVEVNTAGYSENSFYYSMEDERYYNMVGYYYYNTLAGFKGNSTMQEYYGVAKYYEAASLYRAYTVYGKEEQAGAFFQKMKQAEEEMGGWSIAIASIQKQLGIE